MKAMAFAAPGSPEVLRLMEFADPQAGRGEVRVRVRAAGVQPADYAVRQSGWAPPGATLRFPQIPGNEFAGVIDQLGEGVEDFAVGDEVLGFRVLTCYAELVTASAEQVVRKPPGMDWAVAGALSASGQTAHTSLQTLGIGPGDTVLIHAAAGGVGTVAVQLARLWGATVIGTASERNHDYLRSLGAIPVAYGAGMVERVRAVAPGSVDVVVDGIGGEALRDSLALVADKGRIGTLVAHDLAEQLGVRKLFSQRSAARLAELAALHEQGELQIHIGRRFPLREAAEAHRQGETGHGRGKLVLVVD
jgi:NADPH:quinone reductase-like Zn-dependent oxidoreductase